MTYSVRVGAGRTNLTRPSWARDFVQARAADVVLAAAAFRPNAAGSHELTVGSGFGHRQLLKASGTYVGEHVVLGLTALHVHVVKLRFSGRTSCEIARWPRAGVHAELISARGSNPADLWPAVLLTDSCGNGLVELRAEHADDETWDLLTLLLRR